MDTIDIRGRRYTLASLGNRWFAQFLDGLIYLGMLLGGMALSRITNSELVLIVAIAVAVFYLLFQDGLANGQSWGKKAVGTKVIDASTAEPCKFSQSFVRNLLLGLLSCIDWIFIFGDRRQRLGDRAADTVVVEDQAPGTVEWKAEDPGGRWQCPQCENGNPNTTFTCTSCGYSLR